MAVFQRRFPYFPDRRPTRPAEAGMSGVEELRLLDNGEMLVAWHPTPRDGHPEASRIWTAGSLMAAACSAAKTSRIIATGAWWPSIFLRDKWGDVEILAHFSHSLIIEIREG